MILKTDAEKRYLLTSMWNLKDWFLGKNDPASREYQASEDFNMYCNVAGMVDRLKREIEIREKEKESTSIADQAEHLREYISILESNLRAFMFQNADRAEVSSESVGDMDYLSMKIDECGLGTAIRNVLWCEDIFTVKDLISKTEMDLLKLPNFGRKSLRAIQDFLNPRKLYLGMRRSDDS
jgi:DNA-directed RNA polymerase alpha subunit